MRLSSFLVLILLVSTTSPALLGQRAVNPQNRYERLVCVVPMIGTGTAEDPRRPQFAPAGPDEPTAILSYSYILSDDEQFALVEYVSVDQSAFAAILTHPDPRIKKFIKGRAKREDVEAEFRKYRKNFDLREFGARVQ